MKDKKINETNEVLEGQIVADEILNENDKEIRSEETTTNKKDANIALRATKDSKNLWDRLSHGKDKEEVLVAALNALMLQEKELVKGNDKAIDNFVYHTRALTQEYSNVLQILADTENRVKIKFQQEIDLVHKTNAMLLAEKKELKEEVQALKEEKNKFNKEMIECESSIKGLQELIEAVKADLKREKQTVSDLRDKLEDYKELKIKNTELEANNIELKSSIEELNKIISNLNNNIIGLKSEITHKENENKLLSKDLENTINILDNTKESNRKEIARIEQLLEYKTYEINEIKNEINEIKKKNSEIEERNKELNRDNFEKESKLIDKDLEIEKLKKELQKMKETQ